MKTLARIARYARLASRRRARPGSPPLLILFITSICNQRCEHCFYWRSLNGKDDLTFDELVELSRSMGRIENLNLSGGEPFLRPEMAEICRQFIRQNKVRQIYVPTNGALTSRVVAHVEETLKEKRLDLFAVELSLDGMPEFHDEFRDFRNAFQKAMETYDALAEVQRRDARLRIHAISTATDRNMDQIRELTAYLYDRCPRMDHHNLAIIRGDRKNPSLEGPRLDDYRELYAHVRGVWADREAGRFGAAVEPLLQWAKLKTVRAKTQVIPCSAGVLSGVVYANGDVSVCETHPPLGNLRQRSFPEIWNSPEAAQLRKSIACRACFCTNEVFMWPSIVYRPLQLARSMLGARIWRQPAPGRDPAPPASAPHGDMQRPHRSPAATTELGANQAPR